MKSTLRVLWSVLVGLGLSGCLSTMQVHHGGTPPTNNTSLKGVPFYVKKAMCVHETVWAEPVYRVTLQQVRKTPPPPEQQPKPPASPAASKDGKDTPPPAAKSAEKPAETVETVAVVVLDQTRYDGKEMSDLVAKIAADVQPRAEIGTVFSALVATQAGVTSSMPGRRFPTESERTLISNTTAMRDFVAYNDPHYYNVERPWIGSASTTVKLASDGTLSDVEAKVESKTLQSFLDLLPVKDVLTSLAKSAVTALAVPESSVHFQLVIERVTYLHTLSQASPLDPSPDPPCGSADGKLTDPDAAGVDYTRREVNSPAAASDDGKKPAASTVKFSGDIQLPGDKKPTGKE